MGSGPNINLVKDPRYGRNSELAGEDPLLSGSYAASFVRGMQQVDGHGRLKMLAYLKHYSSYSKEASRFTFGANVSAYDWFDSYLPQFEQVLGDGRTSPPLDPPPRSRPAWTLIEPHRPWSHLLAHPCSPITFWQGFKEGKASGAMCSYFAGTQPRLTVHALPLYGVRSSHCGVCTLRAAGTQPGHGATPVPSCGSHWLLSELVRTQWARPDATFMSDCASCALDPERTSGWASRSMLSGGSPCSGRGRRIEMRVRRLGGREHDQDELCEGRCRRERHRSQCGSRIGSNHHPCSLNSRHAAHPCGWEVLDDDTTSPPLAPPTRSCAPSMVPRCVAWQGLDVYGGWGDHLWTEGYLQRAIQQGASTEETLDAAVRRVSPHRGSHPGGC
jgi:hypothetical protein